MFIPNRWSVGISPESEIVTTFRKRKRTSVKKIGVQYDTFGCGGAERVAAELIKIYLDLGYEVILYTNVDSTNDDYSLPRSVVRRVLPSENNSHELRFSYWEKEVENGLDVCVYNSWVSGWAQFDCWALKSLGVVFVYYTHNVFHSWFRSDIADYLSRALPWIASRADAVVAINRASADFFSLYSDAVAFISNPIDQYLKKMPPSEYKGHGKNIVWVGRISDEKRPYEAVRIMAEVCKTIPDAHMYLLGGNPDPEINEPESISRYAYQEIGLTQEQITFTGFCVPYSYLMNSDVYLQTSEYEGSSLTLAEAMRYGLPCVCYTLDYQPLLESHNGALMVEIGDVVGASRAIVSLLENASLRSRASYNAYKTYDEVCRVDVLAIWEKLLKHLEHGAISFDAFYSYQPDYSREKKAMNLVLGEIGLMSSSKREEIDKLMAAFDASKFELSKCVDETVRLKNELSVTRRDCDALQEVVADITNSKAFKLGEALATPYRKIRRK